MRGARFEPIGHVETAYSDPASVPSQASQSESTARVVIDERFAEGLLGLDRYPYLWLLTWLHDQPADRPLRLVPRATEATGEVQGVFASRAPVRPNPIGLSLVRQVGVDGCVVSVSGSDLLDGTAVLDIKPWFPDCDLPRSADTEHEHRGRAVSPVEDEELVADQLDGSAVSDAEVVEVE